MLTAIMQGRRLCYLVCAALGGPWGCGSDDALTFESAFRCGGPYSSGVVGVDQVYMSGAPAIRGAFASVFTNHHFHADGYVTVEGQVVSGGTIDAPSYHPIGGRTSGAASIPFLDPSADIAEAEASNNNAAIPCIPYNDGLNCRNAVQNGILTLMNVDQLTLPSGVYFFDGVFIDGSARLRVDGEATIYLRDGGQFNGATEATSLTVISATADTIEFNGSTQVQMDLYAPYATVLFTGGQGFRGSVVGSDVRLTGSAVVHTERNVFSLYPFCELIGGDETNGSGGSEGGSDDAPTEPLPELPS